MNTLLDGLEPIERLVLLGNTFTQRWWSTEVFIQLWMKYGHGTREDAQALAQDLISYRDPPGIENCAIPPAHLAMLVDLEVTHALPKQFAKKIFGIMWEAGPFFPPTLIMEYLVSIGQGPVQSESVLDTLVEEVIKENPKIADDVRGGKMPAIGSLIGKLMKKTNGGADAKVATELFKKKLLP